MEKIIQQFVDIMQLACKRMDQEIFDLAAFEASRAYRLLFEAIEEQPSTPHLGADAIKAIIDSIKIVEVLYEFPELEKTGYTIDILQHTKQTVEQLLMGDLKEEDALEQFKGMDKLLTQTMQVVNYLSQKQSTLGALENPSLSVSLEPEGQINLYARLGEQQGLLSLAQAAQLHREFLKRLKNRQENKGRLFNLASQMMTKGAFAEAASAFGKLAERFPEYSANLWNCIGACHFYLKEYEKALPYYKKALKAGAILGHIEYNIWETCVALVNDTGDRNEKMRWKFYYEECFSHPNFTIQV
ncbi:MAG: tetratricopeptide repeat protein [Saprospiraceae bacterium]|nr:tetratricopeptide repeat protein [Saprospiraceae bacterium]